MDKYKYLKYKGKYINLKKKINIAKRGGGEYKNGFNCNPDEDLLHKFCEQQKTGEFLSSHECIDECMSRKRINKISDKIKSKTIQLSPDMNLFFYHGSSKIYDYPNRFANWFNIVTTGDNLPSNLSKYVEKEKNLENIEPIWGDYVSFYKLKKNISVLLVDRRETLIEEITEFMRDNMGFIRFKDEFEKFKKKISETDLGSIDDYEYQFAYYICTFTNLNGWISDTGSIGWVILCGNTENLLTLTKRRSAE